MKHMPQTLQTLKTKDRKLHRLKILQCSFSVRYVPCWGEGQTSVLSMKTKAAPQQISKGHLSPSQKHCEVERLDLHPETQQREKTLPKYCTYEKAVSKPSLRM